MTKAELITEIRTAFPYARLGFIKIMVDAIELHSKKNHDYNGPHEVEPIKQELLAKFLDIRRKYNRLHHTVIEEEKVLVDEKLEDTVIDLGNYAFLFAEYLKTIKK